MITSEMFSVGQGVVAAAGAAATAMQGAGAGPAAPAPAPPGPGGIDAASGVAGGTDTTGIAELSAAPPAGCAAVAVLALAPAAAAAAAAGAAAGALGAAAAAAAGGTAVATCSAGQTDAAVVTAVSDETWPVALSITACNIVGAKIKQISKILASIIIFIFSRWAGQRDLFPAFNLQYADF